MVSAGCATPLSALKARTEVPTEAGPFTVQYGPGDEAGVQKIQIALEHASPKLSRWGGLRDRVTMRVMPSHELLEKAVNREGYDWLRAWAKYDEVFIQTPKTWSLFGAQQGDVDELVLHELTHCVMYQASASRTSWTRKQIPLWFREGMASYTAKQAYRWPSLEELAKYLESDPSRDPITAPESLYQKDNDIVYGAAHHAFTFLVNRYGEDRVREILAKMGTGGDFPGAFKKAIGVEPEIFTNDFKRYLRMRGFRGGRVIHRASPVMLPPGTSLELTPPPGQVNAISALPNLPGCQLP
ncbi:MAG: peptidase MA family metallohydrolase [Myxococcaceae bacterium]